MNFHNIKYKIFKDSEVEWNSQINNFYNSNIYQTIAFNKNSIGGDNLEQFFINNGTDNLSAALVRIKYSPVIRRGVAYIRWAPLINKSFQNMHNKIFNISLNELKNEYVIKRKLALRIMFNDSIETSQNLVDILVKNGFTKYSSKTQSIIISLERTEDEIRAAFRKKWRYSLRQAEKRELTFSISDDEKSFDDFINIYNQMHSRKGFKEYVSVDNFKRINSNLPKGQKCKVFICKKDSTPLAAMVVSALGNTGIYLLGGSTSEGLKNNASYYLQWQVIQWLKKNNFKYYDLGGIDKESNPGVYTFKSGMGGKEIEYIGGYECVSDPISKSIVKLLNLMK